MKKTTSRVKHTCTECQQPINKGRATFTDTTKHGKDQYTNKYYHWHCRPGQRNKI